MRVIIPGHRYEMDVLDGSKKEVIDFVMRYGPGYPGNKEWFSGTLMQEVLRVLIDRTKYLNNQVYSPVNPVCIFLYRVALNLLEWRATRRHKLKFKLVWRIEEMPTRSNGHIY